MRAYTEEPFHGIPSNYPLKSPSPDMKAKNTLVHTLSPHSTNLKRSFNDYTPPPNLLRNGNYSEYSTLPHFHQQITQHTQNKIQMMFSNSKNYPDKRQYSSTHAKGSYDFEMPQQVHPNCDENNKNDLMTTGKKIIYQSQINQPLLLSNRKNDEFLKIIEEKDLVISELKDMINLMTQNGKHLKISQQFHHQQEYEKMKNDVKILTIQNQKLSEVIDKLKQKNQNLTRNRQTLNLGKNKKEAQKGQLPFENSFQHSDIGFQSKFKQFQGQINNLKQILSQKEIDHAKQVQQLRKINESVTLECRFFENQKQRFSKENQRLINLLKLKDKEKQTCYKNYSYFDKSQYENSAQNSNSSSLKNPELGKYSGDQGSGRLSIQKIKAQYEQNLKLYKENVYNEVYQMFDTINLTLEEINDKVNGLEQKIVEMQRFRDSWKQRAHSHLTSVEENEEQIKKSAIYIEEAPSSERMGSSLGKSRQALSMILEESRRDNEKLQLQISQLKKQVEYYKDNLNQKLLIKKSESQKQISESYEKRIRQLENFLDELRQEKETVQNELADVKHQLQRALKENYQSTKLSGITQDQPFDEHNSLGEQKQLQQEILLLTKKLDSKQIQEQRLLKLIRKMEDDENLRQKELLCEIERFQTLIKQTEEQLRSMKQDYQSQINNLHEEIQFHKTQKTNIQIESRLLQRNNEELKLQLNNLETTHLNNLSIQKNMEKIQFLIQAFKATQEQQDFLTSIKTYVESLQVQIINKNRQNIQLIKFTQNQKVQIMNLQQTKVELNQQMRCLKEKLKIYQLQFEKNKQFYSKFLNNKSQLEIQKKLESNPERFNSKNPKSNAKSKIDDLLNLQQKKINQLIDSIANLTKNKQLSFKQFQ